MVVFCEVTHGLYADDALIFQSGKGQIRLVSKMNEAFHKFPIETSNRH